MATLTLTYTTPSTSAILPANTTLTFSLGYSFKRNTSHDYIPNEGSGYIGYEFYLGNLSCTGASKAKTEGMLAAKYVISGTGTNPFSDFDTPVADGYYSDTYGEYIHCTVGSSSSSKFPPEGYDSSNSIVVYTDDQTTLTLKLQIRDFDNKVTKTASVTLNLTDASYTLSFDGDSPEGGMPSSSIVKYLKQAQSSSATTAEYPYKSFYMYRRWVASWTLSTGSTFTTRFVKDTYWNYNKTIAATAEYVSETTSIDSFLTAITSSLVRTTSGSTTEDKTGSYLANNASTGVNLYRDPRSANYVKKLMITITVNGVTGSRTFDASSRNASAPYGYDIKSWAAANYGVNFGLSPLVSYTASVKLDALDINNSVVASRSTSVALPSSSSSYTKPMITITSAKRSSVTTTGSVTFSYTQTHDTSAGNATVRMTVGTYSTTYWSATDTATSASSTVSKTTSVVIPANITVTVTCTLTDGAGQVATASYSLTGGSVLMDGLSYNSGVSFGEMGLYKGVLNSAYPGLIVTGATGGGETSWIETRPAATLSSESNFKLAAGANSMYYSSDIDSSYSTVFSRNEYGTNLVNYAGTMTKTDQSFTYAQVNDVSNSSLTVQDILWSVVFPRSSSNGGLMGLMAGRTNSSGTMVQSWLIYQTSAGQVYMNGVNYSSQSAKYVLAAPTTTSGQPTFRQLSTSYLSDWPSGSYGSGTQPIYWSNGSPTASTSTVGSGTKPIWLSSGTLTVSSSTVGASNKPIFLSSGTLTASSSTIGAAKTPIYMSNGVLTAGTAIDTLGYKSSVSGTVDFFVKKASTVTTAADSVTVATSTWKNLANFNVRTAGSVMMGWIQVKFSAGGAADIANGTNRRCISWAASAYSTSIDAQIVCPSSGATAMRIPVNDYGTSSAKYYVSCWQNSGSSLTATLTYEIQEVRYTYSLTSS